MNTPTRISDEEIDGRINELVQQRDAALSACILRAGEISILRKRIKELEHELDSVPKFDPVVANHTNGNGVIQSSNDDTLSFI